MSAAPQYQGPAISPDVPWEIRLHLTQIYQKLGNHNQGFGLLNEKINAIKKTGSTVTQVLSGAGGGGSSPTITSIGNVDNQTGQTTYATQSGDNGALLVLSDASPIAVTLAAGTYPYFLMIANIGAGTATLTPAVPPSGTSTISYPANAGAVSMPLPGGQFCIAAYDGTNWFAAVDVLAQSFAHVTHEWLDSYDATTGLFTASRPDYSDLTGTPTLPATQTPVSHEFLTGYNAGTGAFSLAQPVAADVVPASSTTVGRPAGVATGFMDFDTTLGIPIWWNGANWVNASGTVV